jgi:hypothetical protein
MLSNAREMAESREIVQKVHKSCCNFTKTADPEMVLRSYVSRIRPAGEDRRPCVEVAVDSVRVVRARVSGEIRRDHQDGVRSLGEMVAGWNSRV